MTHDLTEERVKLSGKAARPESAGHDRQRMSARGVTPSAQVSHPTKGVYSTDTHYHNIVQHLEDLDTIPDPPEQAKNAFAITLFCMEAAFDSRSKDFLKHAFDRFPDRDYLIVTQPHTVAENSLLQKFTLVPKKPENTFTHVLYIVHRDSLYEEDLTVGRS